MKTLMNMLVSMLVLTCLAAAADASSIALGNEITIYDGNGGTLSENNETEPGMVNSQAWDLEGFFLRGTSLYMVGGFDFVNGASGSGHTFTSGDIFIDVDRNAQYGDIHSATNGNVITTATNGYDYVLDLEFSSSTYDLVQIIAGTEVITSYYKENQGSNPWQYSSKGKILGSGFFSYNPADAVGEASEFFDDGDIHNVVMVDLSLLLMNITHLDTEMLFHFTMGCGNDNLMGRGTPTPNPEPATMILLGFGLLGLAGLGRKRLKRK